jgi:cytochrome d ubiquinol oxidase subunit I
MHGLNTLKHQPAKIAAMEGHWENHPGEGFPLLLFAVPDMKTESNRYEIGIPRLGSLILTHSLDGEIPGLKAFPPEDRPNATVVFWSFRVMVGLGLLMILLALWAAWARWRGRLYDARCLQGFAIWMGPTGLIAILAGWYTTEIGRQPWVVYGLMRTSDAATPHSTLTLGVTLAVFLVVYLLVFGVGIWYLLRLLARPPEISGPDGHEPDEQAPGMLHAHGLAVPANFPAANAKIQRTEA